MTIIYKATNKNEKLLSESIKGQTGDKNPFFGKHHTEKAKKKMSDCRKGVIPWNKGKPRSEETKRKISKANKGKPSGHKGKIQSEETKKILSEYAKNRTGNKNSFFGKHHTEETKNKLRKVCKENANSVSFWKDKKLSEEHKVNIGKSGKGEKNGFYGKTHTIEAKKIISASKKLTIEKIKHKYSLFSKIEEMRYNPDKLIEEKEIQVHCKNHNCLNSKEQGGWFTPSRMQLYERIRHINDNGGSYFYCSNECKKSCILYNLHSDPFKNILKPYTDEEYNIWRKVVLEQDNYECQICGSKKDLHCHHIIPIKIEPMFALDPDNGIVLCKNCHYKYGHKTKTECSTGNLANRNCNKEKSK